MSADVKRGTTTYVPDIFIDVDGVRDAQVLSEILVAESVFFCVEPFPDDEYRFYFKKEFDASIKKIFEKNLPKALSIQCNTLSSPEMANHIEAHGDDYWNSESEKFPVDDWKHEVQDGNTRLGYWEWLHSQIRTDKYLESLDEILK